MFFVWPPLAIARRIMIGMVAVFAALAVVNAVGGSTFGAVASIAMALIAALAAGVLTFVERRRSS